MCGKGSAEVVRPAHFHPNGWVAPTRSGERRLEGQREAALPGDVVLRLVEPVAVELVDEVPTLGANADARGPSGAAKGGFGLVAGWPRRTGRKGRPPQSRRHKWDGCSRTAGCSPERAARGA